MTKQPGITVPIQPCTDEYKDALATGRICITCCTLGGKKTIYCVNIYGWTNGHTCKLAASRTSALCHAARCELRAHPPPCRPVS